MAAFLLCCAALAACALDAQSPDTQTILTGVVRGPAGEIVRGAAVVAEHETTGRRHETVSSDIGIYRFDRLPAGRYRVSVVVWHRGVLLAGHRDGIDGAPRRIVGADIYLEAVTEHVTVESSATAGVFALGDSAVGVGFSRSYLELAPLAHGPTLQSLLALVPGIVTTESTGTLAQFTAAGQRRTTNRLTIDGMSADLAVDPRGPGISDAQSGSLPALTTTGSTQAVVAFAAVDEIQIRTTGAPAEQRRAAGAQTVILTRAGSERLTARATLDARPDGLAARDWFANAGRAPQRQTSMWAASTAIGGPILPRRLVAFGTWERQLIDRPITTTIRVPSRALRESASPIVRPLLDAYPQPNGRDLGQGLAEFTHAFPVSSRVATLSLRLDGTASDRHRAFVRVHRGTSSGDEIDPDRYLPRLTFTHTESTTTTTATAGVRSDVSGSLLHDLRANVSTHRGAVFATRADYGGAAALPIAALIPSTLAPADAQVSVSYGPDSLLAAGRTGDSRHAQLQIVDTWTGVHARHQWRVGADYRRVITSNDAAPTRYRYTFANLPALLARDVQRIVVEHFAPARALMQTWAVFAQDSVRLGPRVTVDVGARYRVQPAPASRTALQPLLYEYDALPALVQRPSAGSRLWRTSYGDLAPQLAATWQAASTTTIRAGWALTPDELTTPGAAAFGRAYPFASAALIGRSIYPLTSDALTRAFLAPLGPGSEAYAFPDDLHAPRTYGWYASVDQALGRGHQLGTAYVGTAGRDLVYWHAFDVAGQRIHAYANAARSDSHALLVEYARRLSRRGSGRVAYTWGHAIDTDSGETLDPHAPPSVIAPALNRGAADFDRRHVLQASGSLRLPPPRSPAALVRWWSDWQLDASATWHSGAPISVVMFRALDDGAYWLRPDLTGAPVWLDDASAPSGRRLNPAAFVEPDAPQQGTLGRNALRASPLRQLDLSLSRVVRVRRAALTLRLDAFNVLNVPNFGPPESRILREGFGLPLRSYADALGTGTLLRGGLTPVQQAGGSRAIQLGVRVAY